MIQLLDAHECRQLDTIFKDEWDAYCPIDHASILAEVDDGELVAFIPVENVVLVSGVYVAPNHRGMSGARALSRLIKHLEERATGSGKSFLMVRHDDRADHFMGKTMGFRKFGDIVYRTDRFRND